MVNSGPPEGEGVLISWGFKDDDWAPLAISVYIEVDMRILVILAYSSLLGTSTEASTL